MALIKSKPTSPGRRGQVRVKTDGLHTGKPFAGLVEKKNTINGRNNKGRITVRHRGGGHKRHYRVVDFKRNKDGIPAKIERIEYDPNRSSHIALALYADGERRYIIAAKGLKTGDTVLSGVEAPISTGNALPLRYIPGEANTYSVELKAKKGAQIGRAAGSVNQSDISNIHPEWIL